MPVQLPDGRAQAWFGSHTFSNDVDVVELAAAKTASGSTVSVCLPARNEAATIGSICSVIREHLMQPCRLVDELIVIDSGSTDGTAKAAVAGGATVVRPDELLSQGISGVPGKGAALWRSLAAASGDIVVWLDADTKNFSDHFVTRLIAPLLVHTDLKLVKAFYDRPLANGGLLSEDGGGRVTELLVRPLLNLYYPALAGVIQPLAGECAFRRTELMQLPFVTGYGIEVALLLDLAERWGLEALAQADLGVRVHRNRDLLELGQMSFEILKTLLLRFEDLGLLKSAEPLDRSLVQFQGGALKVSEAAELVELPPMAEVVARGLRGTPSAR